MSAGDARETALRRAADRLARHRDAPSAAAGTQPCWDAAFFGLDRVPRFRDAPEAARARVLALCGRGLLAEALHIERSGIDYCARMMLAAEGDDERRLFALIGADESQHAGWLADALPDDPPVDAFNRFIAGIAAAGAPQPLAYLLQVVLEGFGIAHYDGLAAGCRDAGLAAIFRRLARDEALHHAGGLAAFSADRLTDADRRFLSESTYAFLQMIRCGPQAVVAAVDQAIGIGDAADAARVFAALQSEAGSAAKLARLKDLIAQPGMAWLVGSLDAGGAFAPCTAAECAQIYASMR
jgi:rubrerythrin